LDAENYDALLNTRFDRVVAMDWLGMGGSSRPFCGNSPRRNIFNIGSSQITVTAATDFFIDSFEVWKHFYVYITIYTCIKSYVMIGS
jgi:pimeloyl-ACP methyl ester carboxylesterase